MAKLQDALLTEGEPHFSEVLGAFAAAKRFNGFP